MKTVRKIDTTIKVGDRVRSYDFEQSDDCYVDGIVVNIINEEGSQRYKISMIKKVFSGKDITEKYVEETGNTIFLPPVNGTETWMGGKTCGVQKLR